MTIVTPTLISPERVLEIAHEAHEGQVDLAGQPYVHHPIRVANMMIQPRHQMIALLHDVIEDTDWTAERLLAEGLPLDALGTLRLLTRAEGQPYEEYIEGMVEDLDAMVVKMADLRDNMDISRLPELGESAVNRLKKYHKAYQRLQLALGTLLTTEEADDGTKH